MALAPAPQLAACLRVLYLASIRARVIGYEGHETGLSAQQADQVADLMDTIHNIPHLVSNWAECDESLLRGMLNDCDTRWNTGLLHAYDDTVAENAKQ